MCADALVDEHPALEFVMLLCGVITRRGRFIELLSAIARAGAEAKPAAAQGAAAEGPEGKAPIAAAALAGALRTEITVAFRANPSHSVALSPQHLCSDGAR